MVIDVGERTFETRQNSFQQAIRFPGQQSSINAKATAGKDQCHVPGSVLQCSFEAVTFSLR